MKNNCLSRIRAQEKSWNYLRLIKISAVKQSLLDIDVLSDANRV